MSVHGLSRVRSGPDGAPYCSWGPRGRARSVTTGASWWKNPGLPPRICGTVAGGGESAMTVRSMDYSPGLSQPNGYGVNLLPLCEARGASGPLPRPPPLSPGGTPAGRSGRHAGGRGGGRSRGPRCWGPPRPRSRTPASGCGRGGGGPLGRGGGLPRWWERTAEGGWDVWQGCGRGEEADCEGREGVPSGGDDAVGGVHAVSISVPEAPRVRPRP